MYYCNAGATRAWFCGIAYRSVNIKNRMHHEFKINLIYLQVFSMRKVKFYAFQTRRRICLDLLALTSNLMSMSIYYVQEYLCLAKVSMLIALERACLDLHPSYSTAWT